MKNGCDKHTCFIGFTLDQLDPMLNPGLFFRINRKYMVSNNACTNSRLRLKMEGIGDSDSIVVRERVQEFKNWQVRKKIF